MNQEDEAAEGEPSHLHCQWFSVFPLDQILSSPLEEKSPLARGRKLYMVLATALSPCVPPWVAVTLVPPEQNFQSSASEINLL